MRESNRITITTFWMDWLLLPVVLGAAWLTIRWALADVSQAANSGAWAGIPAGTVSIPLLVGGGGWLVVGFGMLVKEEYWEFRIIRVGLILWALCSLSGAILMLLSLLQGRGGSDAAGVLNLIGLALMSFMIVFPAGVDHSSVDRVIRAARGWSVLLAICVGCIVTGTLLGFPYNFPRFPWAVGAFFLVGLGLVEITWCKTSFPWLLRVFQSHAGGREYHESFPVSSAWRIEGAVKMVVGMGAAVLLVLRSL